MKKITLTLFALCMTFMSLNAQDGRIIYVDNIYPSTIYAQGYITGEPYQVFFDFDNDWTNDLIIRFIAYKIYHIEYFPRIDSDWQYAGDLAYSYGDTLSGDPTGPIAPYVFSPWNPSPSYEMVMEGRVGIMNEDGVRYVYVRKPWGDGYCYGWIRLTLEMGEEVNGNYPNAECHIQDYAFCTIPDYPLRVGQTSLEDDIAEHNAANIMVYPNPTTGIINVSGENITAIEVVNIMGQTMLKKNCDGDEANVDISSFTPGIYFVKAGMNDGNEFSEKIIKE